MRKKNEPSMIPLVGIALLAVIAINAFAPPVVAQSSGTSSKIQGLVPNGTAGVNSVNPVTIAGATSGGVTRTIKVLDSGALFVSPGISSTDDTVVASGVKTSNGGTLVAIAAGSGSLKVYLAKLVVQNTSTTVFHSVQLCSSGGTVLSQFELSARSGATGGGGALIVDDTGFYQSAAGEGLSFKFTDGTGSATDVLVTAMTVTK